MNLDDLAVGPAKPTVPDSTPYPGVTVKDGHMSIDVSLVQCNFVWKFTGDPYATSHRCRRTMGHGTPHIDGMSYVQRGSEEAIEIDGHWLS